MQAYQERVVDEYKELQIKREKLGLFIAANATYKTIPSDEQERMREQFNIMMEYERILEERITHFR